LRSFLNEAASFSLSPSNAMGVTYLSAVGYVV
jgi:hypothetical protein